MENGNFLFNLQVSDFKLYSREHVATIHPNLERHYPFDKWVSRTIECPQQQAR